MTDNRSGRGLTLWAVGYVGKGLLVIIGGCLIFVIAVWLSIGVLRPLEMLQ